MQRLWNCSWESRARVCWLMMCMLGIHVVQEHLCASARQQEVSVLPRHCKKSTKQPPSPCRKHRGAIDAAATSFRAHHFCSAEGLGSFKASAALQPIWYFCLLAPLRAQLRCKLKQVRGSLLLRGLQSASAAGTRVKSWKRTNKARVLCSGMNKCTAWKSEAL